MSEETLTQTLESRGLDTSGTAQERVARLEELDRTCTVPATGKKIVIPPISDARLAKLVYVRLDPRCLGVETCVDIPLNIPNVGTDYTRSVHASVSLDVCTPVISYRFETCSQDILLFDNSIDIRKDYRLSDLFTLRASVKKSTGDDSYTVGLGLKAQVSADSSPLIDSMLVEDFQIPIPGCADFVLPGKGSLLELAKSTGNVLSSAAVRFFMKTLKLDTVLTEGTCEDLDLTPPACPWTIDVTNYLPASLMDKVTCVMTSDCLGITCCKDVPLQLPRMQKPLFLYLPFSFVFSPCDNMKVSLAFGSFTKEEELLNYEFGEFCG
ncbi:uncharacterized protein LOC143301767 [Babylonia areolata]|uniref:uncharacterized protein LOC143301767 n=1 Tax=Babylonia areolata TaxID=304850 RepID=UPI003FD1A367